MSMNKDAEGIEALDLTLIKMKLMHVESGEGWTKARAESVETEYRRFLYLMKKHPNEQISPMVDVDTFWHYHILDTMKYAADCEQAFGYFLHHYPYVGIGDDAAPEDQVRAGERMRELYAGEFGEAQAASDSAGAWCAVAARMVFNCAEPAGSAAAWCAAAVKYGDTAWCAVTGNSAKTAWCAVAGKSAKTAWCAVAADKAKTDKLPLAPAANSAWCAAASPKAGHAWCAVTGRAETRCGGRAQTAPPVLLAA